MLILRSLIIGAVLSVLAAGPVQAVPLYYTFTGEITGPWDSSHILDEELYITFLIDTDVAFDNSINNLALIDYSDNFIVRQGLVDEVITVRVELDCLESSYASGSIRIESEYNDMRHGIWAANNSSNSESCGVDGTDFAWEIGDWFGGFSMSRSYTSSDGTNVGFMGYDYSVYLTDISDTNPVSVSEPAALILMGLGLVGLGFAGRKNAA